VWEECLRVLKPGGHLLSFFGTRTYHRGVVRIEDAGFEIRDQIGWAYGSGFPKSLDVSKAIDKAAGAEREFLGVGAAYCEHIAAGNECPGHPTANRSLGGGPNKHTPATAPSTDSAKRWHGWGTALKPAFEPVVVAQKPYTPQQEFVILAPIIIEVCEDALSGKTDTPLCELALVDGFLSTAGSLSSVLADLLPHASRFTTETATALTTDLRILKSSLLRSTHGTTTGGTSETSGVASDAGLVDAIFRSVLAKCERLAFTSAGEIAIEWQGQTDQAGESVKPNWESIVVARKPLIGTVAENVLAHGTGAINVDGCRAGTGGGGTHYNNRDSDGKCLGHQNAGRSTSGETFHGPDTHGGRWPANLCHDGSEEVLARFPKDEGRFFYCAKASKKDRDEGLDTFTPQSNMRVNGPREDEEAKTATKRANHHPTVKPTELMRWLVRLVTLLGGTVLDPFCGSGSTGKAAKLEGLSFIGIEREQEYAAIAEARINSVPDSLF